MIGKVSAKASLRILRFLEGGLKARVAPFNKGDGQSILLNRSDGRKLLIMADVLDALHRAALVTRDGDQCLLSPEGQKKLKRVARPEDGYQAQHRKPVRSSVMMNGQKQDVEINLNESPLARLRIRKTADGRTWLNDAHVEAGERLRRDFTLGQLMQKVTASWDPTAGARSGGSGRGGKAELSEMSIDARSRLEQALEALGPDLAGVITDVCCFLKGLENVERERRWPPRSAKLMLRTGLDLLARHYGTYAGNSSA